MAGSLNLISVVMILGAVQGLFLSLFVFNSKKHRILPRNVLAVLMFVASCLFFLGALFISKSTDLLIYFGPVLLPLFLTLGPILYLYIASLLNTKFKLKPFHFTFFIPAILAIVYLVTLYFAGRPEQIEFIQKFYSSSTSKSTVEVVFRLFDMLYRLLFLVLSINLIIKYKTGLKSEFSSTDKIDFKWLLQLLFYYGFTVVIIAIVTIFGLSNELRVLIGIYLAIIMYYIGYKFMRISESEISAVETVASKKYEKSGLAEEKKNEISEKLLQIMKEENLFIEPDLSASKLSEKLDVSQNHLSQVINEKFGKNFFEFINGFRIDLAKDMLSSSEYDNLTVLAVGFEVGFQSKSTFNSVFKKITGLTPSEFRKKNQK